MGQQVLTVAGQVVGGVVGAYFGNPYLGAAIGGAIGGYIGGQLFNEDQIFEGPRLADLRIQSSNYGNAVPIVYGTYRMAGNVIWSTDIRELRLEEEQGKGGPETIKVDYQYDLDCAIAIGEPAIGFEFVGIEQIYANGVLIYDTRSGASPQNVFASGQWQQGLTLYPGNETQLPDPTMEAALGVGNVPAYRGTGYVVITGLQLNVLKTSVLPNFEFVVTTSGSVQLGQQLKQVSGLMPVYHYNNMAYIDPTPIITTLGETVRVADSDNFDIIRVYNLDGELLGTEPKTEEELFGIQDYSTGSNPFHVWMTFDSAISISVLNLAIGGGAVFTISNFDMLAPVPSTDILRGIVAGADQRNFLILTSVGSTNVNKWFRVEWDGQESHLRDQGTIDTTGLSINEANDWNASPVYQRSAAFYVSMMESDLTHLWQVDHGNVAVWKIESDTGSPTDKVLSRIIYFNSSILPLRNMVAAGSSLVPAIYADNALAAIITGDADGDQSWYFLYSRLPQVNPDGILLTDILTDLCERSGLDSSEVSFVGISDTVDGFAIGQTMSARAAIEVLKSAYYFDGVDSDTFKFVKRGAASVVEFAYLDLGAGDGAPTTHAVAVQRRQETEIPARVNVRYLSVAADYQVAAQSARRETTGSREIAEVNLPIVFDDDDEAAAIADVLLRERWAGAFTRTFSTTIEYAKYEPTDVVTVDDGNAVRTVRVTGRSDSSSLIEWSSIDEDVEAYDSNAVAASVNVPAQELAPQAQSDFAVLDIPPLTETAEGNESAAYVAAKGYTSNWPGTSIDVSRNEGTTYSPGTAVTQASVMGVALTVLPNFLGGNVFDGASTVRVDVGAGTLSSATISETLDGANYSYLGGELIQFRTATLVSAGVYDLSDFLRARKGTEQYLATHAIGDRFVLLSSKLRNLPLQISDRAIDRLLVRATTGSMLPSDGVVRGFDPIIARLMPYSPVHQTAVRNADGSWHLEWERRDRYMNDWPSGVDVPMSEAAELYDVEIYNVGGELVDTYTDLSDKELDLDSAVLGGSPTPGSINYSVWQKSALVGRGFEANETITQAP